MMEGLGGFQKPPFKPETQENPPDTTTARDLFEKMPSVEQELLLNSLLQKGYTPETLQEWYGVTDIQPLPPEPIKRTRQPKRPEINVTQETAFVCETAYEYPVESTGEQERLSSFLDAACESAYRLGKPFVQANYANGTRVYTYSKKGRKFIPTVVNRKDVVDDFRHAG